MSKPGQPNVETFSEFELACSSLARELTLAADTDFYMATVKFIGNKIPPTGAFIDIWNGFVPFLKPADEDDNT